MTRLLNTPIIGPSATNVASSWIDMLAGLSGEYILRMPPAFCASAGSGANITISNPTAAANTPMFCFISVSLPLLIARRPVASPLDPGVTRGRTLLLHTHLLGSRSGADTWQVTTASALSLTVSSHFGGLRERCVRAPLWQGFGLPIWSTRKAWARRCDCRDTRQTVECATLDHSISRNILERLVGVAGSLARHLQHAFADDVALDLVGTAGDRARRHRHQDLRQQPAH